MLFKSLGDNIVCMTMNYFKCNLSFRWRGRNYRRDKSPLHATAVVIRGSGNLVIRSLKIPLPDIDRHRLRRLNRRRLRNDPPKGIGRRALVVL